MPTQVQPGMMLGKDIEDVARILESKHVKNATRTERTETIDEDLSQTIIEIVGDFEVLDLDDMDLWGGHFKFVIYDQRPQSDEERDARGHLAMQAPFMAAYFTSPTAMRVYKESHVKTVTTTIVTKFIDGKQVDEQKASDEQETTEWVEITKEFARKGLRQFGWRE